MLSKFKVGDVIMFTKDIISGYERDHVLLIPADSPCTIVRINTSHVTVKFQHVIEKLRYIPSRMKKASEFAEALYGK